jgi:hypothetical protein
MAEVWEEFRHQHEFENLARRMKVSPNPRRDVQPMDDDLWEATSEWIGAEDGGMWGRGLE